MLVDQPSLNAPRQPPSISTHAARAVWPSEPSPTSPDSPMTPTATERAHKRPRVDTDNLPSFKTHRRSARTPSSPLTPWRSFRKADSRPLNIDPHCSPLPVHPPVDLSSPHIPSMHPLINRHTLKELDLDSILRNPQLRHDLLFDAGLQFRPTSGRRKRDLSDKYWRAVAQELETGLHLPPRPPLRLFPGPHARSTQPYLLLPLAALSPFVCPPVSVPSSQSSWKFCCSSSSHLPSCATELFDPSGLFIVIGQTLKSHCAPMRDRAVDAMVEAAKACAPGCSGSKADAVKAVRVCLDILELMKLDIANHQLQTLRPFLIETAGQYELKAFNGRKGAGASLDLTRKWIQTASHHLMSSHTIPHPSLPSSSIIYRQLPQTQQIYLSVLKALTDLVFDPPCGPSHASSLPRVTKSNIPYLPLYPETTYLDGARLLVLSGEAADATAIYMFLLLFRQLVFSDPCDPTLKVSEPQLASLKKEIRDISSSHLGHCFNQGSDSDNEKWAKIRQDIVLQIAMRAKEARTSTRLDGVSPSLASAPDERMLKLAERCKMLRNRIRDVVFNQVVALTFPSRDSLTPPPSALASGMEPLADEIRLLSERLSRLAHIHLGVYLPLYEQEDFSSSIFSNA
ncbi:T-complex protein 11-domain-containing protein [Suillus paluster]|uniref:T-complex protein 11-domain-containing protein n=1 Tax=Suillus paluster TaxID=48578 RepID=UPI001B86963B|nr:T-complex protein 11-domain-containing protein [Suillus paluster]KAG1745915.1 T-complex protein 11-domain-containing protein [Suillus paluster]